MADKTLYLIDGSSYFYRAFYAVRGLANSKGMPTNAIYGFVSMLTKLRKTFSPEYLVVVFDAKGPTFREEIYRDYKAHRPPMPEELSAQIPHIKRLPAAYRIPSIERKGVEADDVIGTLTAKLRGKGARFVIVGRDKDLMQIVGDDITMYDDARDHAIDAAEVRNMMGVDPEHIVDLLALMGDASDNIPGVRGIGPKTAAELIDEHGGIEEIYANLAKIKRESVRKRLEEEKEKAFLSKRLAILDRDVPLDVTWDAMRVGAPDNDLLRGMFAELEFKKLLADVEASHPAEAAAPTSTPAVETTIVRDEAGLALLVREIRKSKEVSIVPPAIIPVKDMEIVGLALATGGKAYYIPMGHHYLGVPDQLKIGDVMNALRPLLEDKGVAKFGHDIKKVVMIAARYGVETRGIAGDTMLAVYLVDHTLGVRSVDAVAGRILGEAPPSIADLVGRKGAEEAEIGVVAPVAGSHAAACANLHDALLKKLKDDSLERLYREVDLPLVDVLAEMEANGVMVDAGFLRSLAGDFSRRASKIQEKIFELAGEQFNIESPRQLQRILFERLKLPTVSKTKTGFSTNSDVLEELSSVHPLPAKILEFRSLVKLTGTYVEALPKMVDAGTGRIHPTYHPAVTATGRLSCSDPNLQNIPVRTQEGRLIRKAFIPGKGKALVSADYSQIELRVLAHMSDDDRLIETFRKGGDIHAATASEIFGGESDEETRRRAKVINFGIIYGMGAHGLAREIGTDRGTAKKYIDLYFQRYAGVKTFFDRLLKEAEETAVVRTLMGRRRLVADLKSRNGVARRAAERAAINMPIQGTAADIMRVAMLNVHRRFRSEKVRSKVILQVHDELVAEAPQDEVNKVANILREEMEAAASLRVPLTVDVSVGNNWAEMNDL